MSVHPASTRSPRRRAIGWWVRAVQVRLRFVAALAVAAAVVGQWDVLRTYWDRLTAPAPRDAAMGAVSSDTEYFCPMDPGVLSDWPGKCSVCFMALVRRTKGDMGPTPDGVLARVQLAPERVQLAGLKTEPARYRPLERSVRVVGRWELVGDGGTLTTGLSVAERAWLAPDGRVEVTPDPPDGTEAVPGRIADLTADRVTIATDAPPPPGVRFGAAVARVPLADRAPFAGQPQGEPALRPGEPRALFACAAHPEVVQLDAGTCPKDAAPLERLPLGKTQRIGWWCPMHPKVVADVAGRQCEACGGMVLVPRVVSHRPVGTVLSIPAWAVIDTGTRTVVYLERMPGVFDAVAVTLGPRCGPDVPVVNGLEEGQRVATSGAFLVDAETRLNPALAAGYFGASRSEPVVAAPTPPPTTAGKPLDFSGLSPTDRAAALAQQTCPVTGKPLGSMGPPPRLEVQGRSLFLCCEGCRAAVEREPGKYLAKLKPMAAPHHP